MKEAKPVLSSALLEKNSRKIDFLFKWGKSRSISRMSHQLRPSVNILNPLADLSSILDNLKL